MDQSREAYTYKAPDSNSQWTARPSTTASSTLPRPAAPASSNSSVMDKLQGYAYKAPESGRTVRAPASRLDLDHSHPDELQTLKVSHASLPMYPSF